jgi:hypothetical protein
MRLTNRCGGGVIMNSKTSEEPPSLMDVVLPGGVRLAGSPSVIRSPRRRARAASAASLGRVPSPF